MDVEEAAQLAVHRRVGIGPRQSGTANFPPRSWTRFVRSATAKSWITTCCLQLRAARPHRKIQRRLRARHQ